MRIAKPRSQSPKTYAEVTPKAKPDSFPKGEISSVMSTFWGRITAYNPDELVTKKGLTIYRKMSFDEQVKAALAAKVHAVLSSGYEVQAPELPKEEHEIGEEQKDFTEWNFAETEGHFDSKLKEMMTALPYGFACGEKVFHLIDYGKFAGKVGLKALKFRRPEGIDFETDSYGNLLDDGILQNQRRLPKAKFVRYVYNQTFDNPYGESDLRAAYRPWWQKDTELKYMSIALERFGEPVADISHEGAITSAQRTNLENFVKNVQNRSGLIHEAKIKLDFKYPSPRTSEAYIPAINLHDTHIRIAILMPGLMGLSAEQVTGSFARSRTEFETFLNIIGQLRKDVETTINEQVIKELIDMNYEVTGGQYPTFKFKQITEEHKERLFGMWLQAVNTGAMKKFPEDEAKFRDVLELAPKEDEELAPEPVPGQFGPEGQPLPAEGGFLFQDKDGHLYERSFDAEAQLIEYIRNLSDGDNNQETFDFVCAYCGVHRYHLPGQHDQCEHSTTGECVDPEFEKRNKERFDVILGRGATKNKLPPRTNIGDGLLVRLKSGRTILGILDWPEGGPVTGKTLLVTKTGQTLIDNDQIGLSKRITRSRGE